MTDTTLPADLRRFIGPDGVVQRVRPAAYAWCEHDGHVLLCRVAGRLPGGGHWTLPGGGLRFGEDPQRAAVREVREETGLAVELGELLGVRSAVLEPHETLTGHRIQAIGLLYRAMLKGGDLRDEAHGSSDLARWVPVEELASLPLTPTARWAISLALRG
ncbi:MAG TPA: NUDIX domain-containing protein [Candidatus Limnocylindrales bacterium]